MSRVGRFDRDRPDRYDYDDDIVSMRSGGGRGRDLPDNYSHRYETRPRAYDDDMVRDRRYYDDEPRFPRRELAPEYERRGPPVLEREREYFRDPFPPRPTMVRRQSSLDTYDRRPLHKLYEKEEYPPPARREDIHREDFRAPAYADIPLPKTRQRRELEAPPPRKHEDHYYDDIRVAEPDHYGDDRYLSYPDRIRERKYVRRDDRSSPSRSHRSHSTHARSKKSRSTTSESTTTGTTRSSSASSSSSSSGGTAIQGTYPKPGKTRIPARLVSKRAIIDIGYPFTEEGTTIIIQKALGQENIDALLKLSEDYKKSEQEVAAARSSAGDLDERREEIFVPPPPAPALPPPAPAPALAPAPAPAPAPTQVIQYPPPAPPPAPVVIEAGPRRNVSPSRTSTTGTSWDAYSYGHHHHHHHPEASAPVPIGPLALAERSRSRSRSREIRHEIHSLERELAHRTRYEPVRSERELVKAERLPNGELVLYEQEVSREHVPKPARIEKDKKGRLSLSLPRR
ncbi:hypothetical protein GMORB2_7071 [Geosmithia morbida]|uniref:DUF8035 domain-containing protein n=1 Tax=Geosmithia morbida TaxID=1094350 RepID=A0A9P5D5R7_9HYPO|nr:uncharacterized protein GMORB2_7071 [Geosmithia morbida]KAF4122764.1 hypothetical protein GMORB2_7071 [Geosmithia morbida]